MKALTLHQPWASLVALGVKTIETRSWKTDYRGPLAIHAGLAWPKANRQFAAGDYVKDALDLYHIDAADPMLAWPRGVVLGTVDLLDVVSTDWDYLYEWLRTRPVVELALGDFTVGRFMWVTEPTRRRRLARPVYAMGERGLWDWDPETIKLTQADPTFRHPEGL